MGVLLAAPATAVGDVDPDSLVDQAQILATAFDGGGGSAVTDPSGGIGFAEFVRTVTARDSNSDSGRSGRGDAFQDTRIVEAENALFGVDSQGTASAGFVNPQLNDGLEPVGTGHSELTVEFAVVGDPVTFSLTGEISATATPELSGVLGQVTVVSPSGVNHDAGSGDTVEIEETGELQPGTHTFTVELDAEAFNDGIPNGAASAEYDLQLRFCTITTAESGVAVGTAGDDVICGTPGDDLIFGEGGNDRIFGLGDADAILGGPGDDVIDGGAGDDLRLYGGPGNDVIDGGPGDDGPAEPTFENVVAGGPGDDDLTGGAGSDRLVGRCLESVLGSTSTVCQLDPIAGATDDDNLTGGLGNDILFADAGSNFISGGPGVDIASADGPSVFVLGDGDDSGSGSAGPDEMNGGPGKDTLGGFGGPDCLVGGSGRDDLEGNSGNDKLLAKDRKRDRVAGGAGPDKGRFDSQDRVTSVSKRNLQGGC